MRISIWQQFSSNHSSDFTLVGEFQTIEAAQHATEELRRILQTVVDWYSAHPDADEARFTEGSCPVTPAEIDFAKQYGVELNPEYGIDWLGAKLGVDLAISTWDRLVFVVPPTDTWCGAKPFDRIVEKLGGIPLIGGSFDVDINSDSPQGVVTLDLTCNVPDEKTAQAILDEIRVYQEASDRAWQNTEQQVIPQPPWQSGFRYREASNIHHPFERVGRQIWFETWHFTAIERSLPNLVAYLKKRGCTDIQYKLASKIDQDDD